MGAGQGGRVSGLKYYGNNFLDVIIMDRWRTGTLGLWRRLLERSWKQLVEVTCFAGGLWTVLKRIGGMKTGSE